MQTGARREAEGTRHLIVTEAWGKTVDFLRGRKHAYQLAFNGPAGQDVLRDLAKFCRANETTWHEDASKRDVLIGRREVFLRIQEHLNLTSAQLAVLYSGGALKPGEQQ